MKPTEEDLGTLAASISELADAIREFATAYMHAAELQYKRPHKVIQEDELEIARARAMKALMHECPPKPQEKSKARKVVKTKSKSTKR